MKHKSNRRSFIGTSAAGVAVTLTASSLKAVCGANERIRCGFIGVGNRGTQLLRSFMKQPDVEVAALCDVYEPFRMRDASGIQRELLEALGSRIPRMDEKLGSEVKRYADFRRLLEQKDLDAVVIATPDHWHAIQTIQACEAGKDVYIEKPLSITIKEGRKMVQVAERTNRIVQVGLHRRSSKLYSHVAQMVQAGKFGKVTVARAYRISNMYPHGIKALQPSEPPANLDWDMWLGPRQAQEYQSNIAPYKFRWWKHYSSQMGNWGVHYCDAMRWALGEKAPVSISAHGGCFALDDDRTIPDTLEVTFELPGKSLMIFGQYEASGGPAIKEGEIEFRGTLGNLYTKSEGNGYSIYPSGAGQFQNVKSPLKEEQHPSMDGDMTDQNVRNFLDCVKSRKKTNCDLEAGHRSTTFAHLGNIALATRSRLEWDAENEIITNNNDANDYLHYDYRKPWTL